MLREFEKTSKVLSICLSSLSAFFFGGIKHLRSRPKQTAEPERKKNDWEQKACRFSLPFPMDVFIRKAIRKRRLWASEKFAISLFLSLSLSTSGKKERYFNC